MCNNGIIYLIMLSGATKKQIMTLFLVVPFSPFSVSHKFQSLVCVSLYSHAKGEGLGGTTNQRKIEQKNKETLESRCVLHIQYLYTMKRHAGAIQSERITAAQRRPF